jgi:hypothetical protein
MDKQDEKIHHSELQLVKHDASANAPERDRSAEAPELDQSATAPEVGFSIPIRIILTASRGYVIQDHRSPMKTCHLYPLVSGRRKRLLQLTVANPLAHASLHCLERNG